MKLRGMLEFCLLHGSKFGKVPKTKLFKLVYLGDFSAYYYFGHPISCEQYNNRTYGPVPDPLFYLVDEMITNGDIHTEEGGKGANFHKLAIEPKYVSCLNDEEKVLLKKICEYWTSKPTEDIVNFVHSQRPWSLTKKDEPIPYELILQEIHPYQPTE